MSELLDIPYHLRKYCKIMKFTNEAISELISWWNKIVIKDPDLIHENPEIIAAALIEYFVDIHQIELKDHERIINKINYSTLSIRKMIDRISNLL